MLPGSSQAPATPFIKHKNILLALAQGVLGRQEGGIGPGEVWWPFQLVPQEVCKQARKLLETAFPSAIEKTGLQACTSGKSITAVGM